MKKQDLSDLLTMSQVSKLLNVHPNTLRLWDADGTFPAIRFGKRGDRRYKKEDVSKIIRTKKEQTDEGGYSVISLFAGCGGMDLGFEGGFKVLGKKYKKTTSRFLGRTILNQMPVKHSDPILATKLFVEILHKF